MTTFTAIDGPMKGKEVKPENMVYVFWEVKDGNTVFYDYLINLETKELTFLREKTHKETT